MNGGPNAGRNGDGDAPGGNLPISVNDAAVASRRAFYFVVVFWGKKHRNYFLDLCLPSLLSANNIPALENAEESRIVIVTTKWDWRMVRRHPTYALMERYIKAYPIFVPQALFQRKKKMLVMSRCQKLASEKAHKDGALGVFLAPDVILSDGAVRTLQRLAKEGRKVVLCGVVRFSSEGCLPEIKERCGMRAGEPITLSSRQLIDIGLRSPHSETVRYQWDSPVFGSDPITCMFDGPDGEGCLLHTFSWAPVLVDYSAIERHDTSTFEKWTLDGDYLHRNFQNRREIYVVTDSDEIMLSSYTSEAELNFKHASDALLQGNAAHLTKVRLLRRLFHSNTMDPLKREIFSIPIYWHRREMSADWEPVRRRAASIIQEAISEKPTAEDQTLYHYIQRVQAKDLPFISNLRQHLKTPFVTGIRLVIWCGRKLLVLFYVCFRFFLRPLVVLLKQYELGYKVVCALRGWEDDVVPPGYLLRRKKDASKEVSAAREKRITQTKNS